MAYDAPKITFTNKKMYNYQQNKILLILIRLRMQRKVVYQYIYI